MGLERWAALGVSGRAPTSVQTALVSQSLPQHVLSLLIQVPFRVVPGL